MSMREQGGIGVIGLGAMGAPIAQNLVASGADVLVWNRTAHAADPVVEAGAKAAPLEQIGRECRVVLTVLPDLPEVEEVLNAGLSDGLRAAVAEGVRPVLVVMGTVSPTQVRKLADRLSDQGVNLVDAPVSGGDVGAQRGELSIMAGGNAAVVGQVAAILDPACGTLKRMGEVGAGSLAKACNQMVVGTTLAILSEALLLGRSGGLDDAALFDVLAGGLAGSKALDVKREKWLAHEFVPGGRSRFQLKDLQFAAEAASAVDLDLPVTGEVLALYRKLVDAGYGDDDHAAVIRVLE